jgi:predicted Fe-S protein YdhL (DUF1289 family)
LKVCVVVALLQTPKVNKLPQLCLGQIKRKVKWNTSKPYEKRNIMRVELLKQRVKKQILAKRLLRRLPQAQAQAL